MDSILKGWDRLIAEPMAVPEGRVMIMMVIPWCLSYFFSVNSFFFF